MRSQSDIEPKSPCLLVRADAGPSIGAGHLMRCLALAQAWRAAGGRAVFASARIPQVLSDRLAREGFASAEVEAAPGSAEDAAKTSGIARTNQAAWIAADGYVFGADYYRSILGSDARLLVIDDLGSSERWDAHIVLNQNLAAEDELYPNANATTSLLLGSRYTMLRREFWPWIGKKRAGSEGERQLLATFGGADAEQTTELVIRSLSLLSHIGSTIVVGGANPRLEQLERDVLASGAPVRLVFDAEDMPALMAQADVAVSAAGSTAWELAFMGVPSLLVALAENQLPIARALAERGAAVDLGDRGRLTPEAVADAVTGLLAEEGSRDRMAERGRELIDGEGGFRVVMHMRGDSLRLRPVREADARLLWEWANEPGVRNASFHSERISWDDHLRWFADKLASPLSYMLLAVDEEDRPLGQVRFDIEGDDAEVGVSVEKGGRGRGLGSRLLELGVERLLRERPVNSVHGFVKAENQASSRAFENAGFRRAGELEKERCRAEHWLKVRAN